MTKHAIALHRTLHQQRGESVDRHGTPSAHLKINVSLTEPFTPAPSTAIDMHEIVKSQILDMLHLRNVVKAINANCLINENGQTELHLDSGEVFLVQKTGIIRLK